MNPLQAQTDKLIFLSYSRANRDFARQFYTDLQALGCKLWRDLHEIDAGGDWWEQIKAAINACDTLVLCMSLPALRSPVVSDEWNYARQQGKRVIPVIADEVFKHPDVISGAFTVPNWMTRANWVDFRAGTPERDLIWGRFIQTLNQPYEPRRVMVTRKASELPPNFVPRPNEMETVVRALVNERNEAVAITAALKGAGGYGKTTLAKAICRDLRVSGAFDDGIFWVTLGEDLLTMSRSDRENQLTVRLLDLVTEISGIRPAVSRLEAAQEELVRAIEDRYILLVIDDVWHQRHLEPFLVRGRHNSTLITTRDRENVPYNTFRQNLDAMEQDEAVALLVSRLDKDAIHLHESAFQLLAKRLGNYPLLLGSVNGVLRKLTELRPLDEALKSINTQLDKRGLKAFDESKPQDRVEAVSATLGVSIDQLSYEEQECYRALGIFPEDTRIPLTTLEALWDNDDWIVQEFCEQLYDASLIQDFDGKSIALHDMIRRYLAEEIRTESVKLHTRLVENWGDPYLLPDSYSWHRYSYHLNGAMRLANLRDLLLDYRWLHIKLLMSDIQTILSDCTFFNNDEVIQFLTSALLLSANYLVAHPERLALQLVGRLNAYQNIPDIMSFLKSIPPTEGDFWPLFAIPIFEYAGSPLVRILEGHTDAVNGTLGLSDSRLLSWSNDCTLRLWDQDGQSLICLIGHKEKVLGALELSDGRFLSWSDDCTLRLWDRDGQSLICLNDHKEKVLGALELSDGRFLSWSDDDILLWSKDGQLLARLIGHSRKVNGVIELPEGRLLSWSHDSTLRLWNKDGQQLAALDGHIYPVKGALALPNGRLLSWSHESSLLLWNKDGQLLARLIGHSGAVDGVQVLHDGNFLSWSSDFVLLLWNKKGQPSFQLKGHKGWINGVIELSDGRILSWSKDKTLRLWDQNGKPLARLEGHLKSVNGADVLSDGRLLSWSEDGMRLWDQNGKPWVSFSGHMSKVNGVQELPNGRLLSWSDDCTLRLWNWTKIPMVLLNSHLMRVNGIQKLPNGRILSWSEDGTLRLWDQNGESLARLEGHLKSVNGVQVLPDGRILSWSEDGTLRLWDQNGKSLARLEGHLKSVNGVQVLPDGRLLSWSVADGTMWLWDQNGEPLARRNAHAAPVRGVQILSSGRFLSWSEDGTLQLWNWDVQPLVQFEGYLTRVKGVQKLPNGRFLSWSEDGTLRLWDQNGESLARLEGHLKSVNGAEVLPDGRFLSWSEDGTLRLWDQNGESLARLEGHLKSVNGVQVLPDGRFLSWSEDGTLRLWDQNGESLARLEGHLKSVNGAEVLPDGRFLSWSEDSTLRLWDQNGQMLSDFFGDTALSCFVVLETYPLQVAVGDIQGRVIFLKRVE